MSSGRTVFRPDLRSNGVKVFSATLYTDRDRLGENVTVWIASHPDVVVTEIWVTQSSDSSFHCVALTVFYWEALGR